MTIELKIDNPDIEEQLMQFVQEQKEVTIEALHNFLNAFRKKEKIAFQKKDPRKHIRKRIKVENDDEDLSDVKPYAHVEDSAKYIHDLRRVKNR